MSASRNVDAMMGQGEFSSRVPPSEPLADGKWHKPGVKVGNDAVPEFSAKAYPPGSAPREDTYQPNPRSEIPGQALNDDVDPSARTGPLDSLPGPTSRDVHNATQFGKPLEGQTSTERHGGAEKKDSSGVASRGGRAVVETGGGGGGGGSVEGKVRGLGADLEGRAGEWKGQKGASGAAEGGSNWPGAEDLPPARAEEVASGVADKGGHARVASGERVGR